MYFRKVSDDFLTMLISHFNMYLTTWKAKVNGELCLTQCPKQSLLNSLKQFSSLDFRKNTFFETVFANQT